MPLNAPHPTGRALLQPVDYGLILALMAVGLVGRLVYASGIGLADDFVFRGNIGIILMSRWVAADNQAYRFVWWLPTAFSCRIFGLNEFGLILPFTVTAMLGLALVYVFAKALWGRVGAIIAAALLIVAPLDFAWSTMMTNDMMLSVLSAATILLVLCALDEREPLRKRRLWFFAGLTLWLSLHAKLSGLFLFPAIAAICIPRRKEIDRHFWSFLVTAGVLIGGSLLVSYVLAGNALAAYYSELSFQGLTGPLATHSANHAGGLLVLSEASLPSRSPG